MKAANQKALTALAEAVSKTLDWFLSHFPDIFNCKNDITLMMNKEGFFVLTNMDTLKAAIHSTFRAHIKKACAY